jgi:hypothetical protein
MVESELIAFSFNGTARNKTSTQDAGEPRGHPHRGAVGPERGVVILRRLPYSVRIGESFRPLLS